MSAFPEEASRSCAFVSAIPCDRLATTSRPTVALCPSSIVLWTYDLRSASGIGDPIHRAQELEQPALAPTDHGDLRAA